MLKPDTFALTALLAALTALAPLSTDLYLPTLPDMGRAFGVSPAKVQLTLSAYLVGIAIGQIAYGPISDWYGRKSGLLVALACYCIGSLICFAAPSIDVLIGARVLQAFGGAGAIVLARAVVRDLYSGARAGKELSLMSLVMAFGPVSAPLIGGILHVFFGWRSSFAALLAFGIVVMVMVLRKMPETLGERPQERISLGAMLEGYRQILRSREFNIYLAIGGASYTGLIGWLSAAPFVLQNIYGQTPLNISIVLSLSAVGYLIGALIASRIVLRIGIPRTVGVGAGLMIGGALIMCAVVALGIGSAIALIAGVAIYLAGFGLVFPPSIAGGLSAVAERAGAASSLLGFAPQFSAAILGAIVVTATSSTAWPVAIAVTVISLIVLMFWLALPRSAKA